MRSRSQGDDAREGSGTEGKDRDDQKPIHNDASSSSSTGLQGPKLHLNMPPSHEAGPQSPEMSSEMFYNALETLGQSGVGGLAKGTRYGEQDNDERPVGRKQESDTFQKKASQGKEPISWTEERPIPGATMGNELDEWTGNKNPVQIIQWKRVHEDTKMHEDMEAALETARDDGKPIHEIDPVGTNPSSRMVHDSETYPPSRGGQGVVPRRKPVLADSELADKDSPKPAQYSFYNEAIKAKPILCAYLMKQPIVKEIESKYTASITVSDDGITVSADDQGDVTSAVQRVREAMKEISEEEEVVKSRDVPSHLTSEAEKIAGSPIGNTTCVFDHDSQSVFCMGSGAQAIIEEVDLMVGANRMYEETIHIELNVMSYLSIPSQMPVLGDEVRLNMKPNEDEETGVVTLRAMNEEVLKRAAQEFRQHINEISISIVSEQVKLDAIGAVEKLQSKFPDVLVTLHKEFLTVDLIGPKPAVKEARKKIVEMSKASMEPAPAASADFHRLSQSVGSSGYTEPMSFWTSSGKGHKLHVHALVHDITRMKVDVIVNAANERLQHGGGVAGAIANAAGKELEDDCNNYIKKNGKIKVTNHYVSKPGCLPCKQVMHAVGPTWNKRGGDREQERLKAQLQETFRKCLHGANDKKYNSIAIPPISAGNVRKFTVFHMIGLL